MSGIAGQVSLAGSVRFMARQVILKTLQEYDGLQDEFDCNGLGKTTNHYC